MGRPLAGGAPPLDAAAMPGTGLRVVPLGRAADMQPEDWNGLARRGHHLHRWFTAAEAGGLQPRHLAVYDAGGPRVIIPAYLERGGLHGDLHDRWLGPARGLLATVGLRLRPSLAVVLPLGTASEPLGEWEALPDATVELLLRHLEEQARTDGAKAIVWPFVAGDQERLLRVAARLGYARAFAGSTARLHIEWSCFDEYLASRSKNVRRTVRAELRALAAAGVELRATADFRASVPAMDALYRGGFARRNGYLPTLDVGFFQRIAEQQPGDALWAQTAWQDGALVGTSLNLAAAGRVDGGFAAVAPTDAGAAVYAADLIYEPVRIACEQGGRCIELGPTALQAKLLRGAELLPRFSLVRGTTPAVHASLRALAYAVGAWTLRKEQRALGPLAPRLHATAPITPGEA